MRAQRPNDGARRARLGLERVVRRAAAVARCLTSNSLAINEQITYQSKEDNHIPIKRMLKSNRPKLLVEFIDVPVQPVGVVCF
jgi:hypothetical protein